MNLVFKNSRHSLAFLISCVAVAQLTWWPIESARAECSGADVDTARTECAAKVDKGYTFSEQACRCVNSEQKQALRDNFLKCQGLTGTAMQECVANNADNNSSQTDSGVGNGVAETLGDIQGGITGIATAMALFNFLGAKDSRPGCTSRLIFSATAVVAFGAEVYSYFFLENKLRDLRKQYKDYTDAVAAGGSGSGASATQGSGGLETATANALKSGSVYDAQILAFDYLKKEQETIADVASTKKTTYIIAAVGFGAAMIMALAEAIVPTMIKCTSTPANPTLITWLNFDSQKNITLDPLETYLYAKTMAEGNPALNFKDQMAGVMELQLLLGGQTRSLSLETYKQLDIFGDELSSLHISQNEQAGIFQMIKSTMLADAMATDNVLNKKNDNVTGTKVEDCSFYVSIITGVVAGIAMAASDKFRLAMSSSPGVAIMSGVSMALNIALAAIAAAEEENAKKNAESAQKIKDQFVSSVASYCPNGRENLAEPSCYCYTADRKKNPNRTNSDTCKSLWQRNEQNFFVDPNSKSIILGENIIGCMTINRQFDAQCQCKKFVDKNSGKNACFSVPMTSTSLGGMGAGLGLGNTIKDLNNLSNGNFNRGSVNQSDLNQRAARTKDLGTQLLKKLNDDRSKNKLSLLDLSPKGVGNFVNNMVPKSAIDAVAKSKFSPENFSAQNRPNNSAIKDALAKTGMDKKYEFVGGNGGKKGAEEKKGFNFEMDNQGNNNGGDAVVMDGFMDKKFNFKDNDIVKNGDVSIWQVISNRYTQSALPRLFATDAEIKAMNGEAAPAPQNTPAQ